MQSFQFKKDIMNAYRKKEIVNMAQENLYMFKRLKEKTSHYDFGKYDKEYDQAQYYKRSHCTLLPSIDFSKTKRNFSLGGKYKIIHNSIYNMNVSNSYGNLNPKKCNINNNIIINNTEQNLFNNNLYKKKLEELKYEDFIDIKNNSNNGKNDETKNEEGKNEKNNDNINKNKIVKNNGNNIVDNDNKKEKEVVNKDNDKKNEESDNNNEDNTKKFKKIESIDNENTN